jgi:tetratricopeptide (TPR) repeat protein
MIKNDELSQPWGERLKAWRTEVKDWSQPEFVRHLNDLSDNSTGFDVRLLRKWEAGKVQRPQSFYRNILAKMGAPLPSRATVLTNPRCSALILPSLQPAVDTFEEDNSDVDRRSLLKVSTGTAAAATVIAVTEPWQRLEAALAGGPRVDQLAIDALTLRTRELFDLEESASAAEVWRQVQGHLDGVATLLGTAATSSCRMRLIREAGTASALAGWLAFDQQNFNTARKYYAIAERAAEQVGDAPLTACVHTYRSYLTDSEGDPVASAQLIQAALDALPRGTQPVMRAWLSARQGETLMSLGDHAGALRAFDRAYMASELSAEQDQPIWARFFTDTRLDGMAVATYARINHPDMETVSNRLFLTVGDCRTKVEQIALADLAYAHLERGDVEQGASLGQRALTAIAQSDSSVAYDRLRVIAAVLAPYRASRAASGLQDNLAFILASRVFRT